jgi:hypothetical protein
LIDPTCWELTSLVKISSFCKALQVDLNKIKILL